MNNLLLIGNGFDLAHGLCTSYNDFLTIMKEWPFFITNYKDTKRGKRVGTDNPYYKYLMDVDKLDGKNIDMLGNIITNNSWVNYYCKCEAEIDGWIDFEREICPVIKLAENIFGMIYSTLRAGENMGEVHIMKEQFRPDELRLARLWPKYFDVSDKTVVKIKSPFASRQYGILKKQIIKSLREDFNEFIHAFEIYLYEFVYKREDIKKLKQIDEIGITTVISFNYTLTERIYGIDENDVHHIHGMIRTDFSAGKNNMVVGVNEQENIDIDFIYFVKYFQRIQKASGVKYKELLERKTKDDNMIHTNYILYIYGHSLDETDADILKFVIGKINDKGRLVLYPEKVVIFYYNDADYEQKVINLIKLYGRSQVEAYMEANLFEFIEITDETI